VFGVECLGVPLAVWLHATCHRTTPVTKRPERALCAARNPVLSLGGFDRYRNPLCSKGH
jgi:hypothetical protein